MVLARGHSPGSRHFLIWEALQVGLAAEWPFRCQQTVLSCAPAQSGLLVYDQAQAAHLCGQDCHTSATAPESCTPWLVHNRYRLAQSWCRGRSTHKHLRKRCQPTLDALFPIPYRRNRCKDHCCVLPVGANILDPLFPPGSNHRPMAQPRIRVDRVG